MTLPIAIMYLSIGVAAALATAAIVADAIYQVKLVRQQVITGNLPAMVLLAELG